MQLRGFATGEMSQTQKRDLQRAVTAVILAYNEASANKGDAVPQLTLQENHLAGDGKVHEDRKIPRQSNERDYNCCHTLGVVFADNGKMLPHYRGLRQSAAAVPSFAGGTEEERNALSARLTAGANQARLLLPGNTLRHGATKKPRSS